MRYETERNTLIIGNGFDIAHGLETKYSDFLEYCNRVSFNDLQENDVLRKSIENNFWLSHFLARYKNIGNTWIDFEDEILLAITELSRLSQDKTNKFPRFFTFSNNERSKTDFHYIFERGDDGYLTKGRSFIGYLSNVITKTFDLSKYPNGLGENLSKIAESNSSNYSVCKENNLTHVFYKNKMGVAEYVYDELRRFVRALEYYLSSITHAKPKTTYKIKVHSGFVISFNYTKTFERLYSNYGNKIVYMHGNIDETNTEICNMVLGTRSFSDSDTISECFSIFQKYHQRQRYDTIKEYQVLLNNTSFTKSNENGIGIIGHSLNSTDRFLINSILTVNDKARITVYYHDEQSKIRLINSIYALLGERDADSRVMFVHQHDSGHGILIP